MNIMHKEEQREADIDAIAEAMHDAVIAGYTWAESKRLAALGNGRFVNRVADYRLQAEHVLGSHWLSEKIADAEYDARQEGRDEAYMEQQYEQNLEM